MRLRAAIVALGVVMSGGLLAAAPASAQEDKPWLDDYEREIVRLINEVRAQHGVVALRPDQKLGRAADRHSQDMLKRDAITHHSRQGASFRRRVRRYVRAEHMGEVLAYVEQIRGRPEPPKLIAVWQSSDAHLALLLDRAFRRIGLACRSGRLDELAATVCTADLASDP